MKYEIKIWKIAKKMPDIAPQTAANLLQSVANAVNSAVGAGGNKTNPDILIDQNAGGEDAIKSVDISYITKDVDSHHLWVPAAAAPVEVVNGAGAGIPEAPAALAAPAAPAVPKTTKSRLIKLHIKGNLYLPLDGGLKDDAKRIAGVGKTQGAENKLRDTLLLSQWASVPPEKDLTDHFYRGIIVNIITKAGDFRVITAKKVYVESYVENYNEGEFGTFDLVLVESVDSNNQVTVKGLGYEKPSLLDKVKKGVETTAKVLVAGGAVVAGVGAVGKTVTETVEKFTGETTATRWIKYGFDTAGSAGNVAKSTSNIMKNPKDVKTWTDEITNVNKNVNERIQKGVDAKEDIPLDKMESMYLSVIQKDPDKYKEYINASQEDKYDMLKEASKTLRDRANITKDMEESVAKDKKLSANKKEVANLKKEYLDLINADPEQSEKYNKASMDDKLKMLQEQKKNFDGMQNQYLALVKRDPAKFDEYNNSTTDKQLKMLQEQKKSFDAMEKKYFPLIKKDPAKLTEYNKAPIDQKLKMLKAARKASKGTSTPPSSTDSGTSTSSSSTDSGTSTSSSSTDSGTSTPPSSTDSGTSTPPSSKPPSTNPAPSTAKPNSNGQQTLNDKINAAAQKKNGGSNGK